MAKSSDIIVILGDHALVKEYGHLCHESGYKVIGAINKHSKEKLTLPTFIKKSTSIPRTITIAIELTNLDIDAKKKNLLFLESKLPSTTVILSSSVTVTALEQQSWLKHQSRLVGICALPTLASKKLIEITASIHTNKHSFSLAIGLLKKLGKETSIVQDRIGMVTPRIICSLINESCFAAAEQIASAKDIDTAMKLGTNYPFGPFEWADAIGFEHVFAVLNSIHKDLGEERYRIAPLLKQIASGERWWKT